MDFESELGRLAAPLRTAPVAVGVDVVDISDFDNLPFEANPGFYRRCFSTDEIAYCQSRARPAQHFAVRFAAKEAAVKALAGSVRLAYWQVEVDHGQDGDPGLKLWNESRTAPLGEASDVTALISLTHSDALAAAVVVVYRKDSSGGY